MLSQKRQAERVVREFQEALEDRAWDLAYGIWAANIGLFPDTFGNEIWKVRR